MQTGRRSCTTPRCGGVALTGIGGILYSNRRRRSIASDAVRPMANWGLQIGDVIDGRAIIWSRADRPLA